MGWKVKLGGDKSVNLDELSPALFDELAAESPADTWWTVYTFPAATTDRLFRVVQAAAVFAQVDPPDQPTSVKQSLALVDMLEQVPDIEDDTFPEGFPPTPETPEAGSSSTLPESTDGLPMLSGDSPSETS